MYIFNQSYPNNELVTSNASCTVRVLVSTMALSALLFFGSRTMVITAVSLRTVILVPSTTSLIIRLSCGSFTKQHTPVYKTNRSVLFSGQLTRDATSSC